MSIDVEFIKDYKDFQLWILRKYDIGSNLLCSMSSFSLFQFFREYFLESYYGKSGK